MSVYLRSQLSNDQLSQRMAVSKAREFIHTAEFVADIAAFDARQLYRPAGFDSMYAYCVGQLRLAEGAAYKRIRVGRTARRFPILFRAMAEGRLHLTAIMLLRPFLTRDNVEELVAGATHKSKTEILRFLAQKFPAASPVATPPSITVQLSPETVPVLRSLPLAQLPFGPLEGEASTVGSSGVLSPETVPVGQTVAPSTSSHSPETVGTSPSQSAPSSVASLSPESALETAAPATSAARVTMKWVVPLSTYDKLLRARALMSHSIPSGELAAVLDRALELAIRQLEKRKFAATDRPRSGPPRPRHEANANPRSIPAHVKRAARARDQDQCTFFSESGQRCPARDHLEWDHIVPIARGGASTVDNVRQRCRAHNQYEAERIFGAEFMRGKRERVLNATRNRAGDQMKGVAGMIAMRPPELARTI